MVSFILILIILIKLIKLIQSEMKTGNDFECNTNPIWEEDLIYRLVWNGTSDRDKCIGWSCIEHRKGTV